MKTIIKEKKWLMCFVLMLGCIVIGAVAFMQEHSKDAAPAVPEVADMMDAFENYTYIEQRANGSLLNVMVYPYQDSYYMTEVFKDVGGMYAYHATKLDADMAKRWTNSMSDMQLQPVEEQTKKQKREFTRGVVTFATDEGESYYQVDPMDISGFGVIDPWNEADKLTLVGGMSFGCNKVFPISDISSLVMFDNSPQLSSYIDLLYRQILERVYGKDVPKDVYNQMNRMVLTDTTDDTFTLSLTCDKGEFTFTFTMHGYLLSEEDVAASEEPVEEDGEISENEILEETEAPQPEGEVSSDATE